MEEMLEQAARTQLEVVLPDRESTAYPEKDRIIAIRTISPRVREMVISVRPESAALAKGADVFVNETDPPGRFLSAFKERNQQ